ncbi:hypothetical protein V8E36_008898 [Tilletia maclaganii]
MADISNGAVIVGSAASGGLAGLSAGNSSSSSIHSHNHNIGSSGGTMGGSIGSGVSHVNTRPSVIRFQKACEPCRRRKTKCDRLAPCASCVLRATERLCYSGADSQEAVLVYPSSTTAPVVLTVDGHADGHADGPRPISPGSPVSPATSSSHSGQRDSGGAAAFDPAGHTHEPHHASSATHGRASKRPRHDRSPEASSGSRNYGAPGYAGSSRPPDREYSRSHHGTPILPSTVSWSDCRHYLPAPEVCQDLFLCFFNELDGHFACVHPLHVERIWSQLQPHQGSVRRSSAALVFVVLALSMSLAPKSNPAHRALTLSRLSAQDIFQIAVDSLQYEILKEPRQVSLTAPDFERLQALDLCCHFANMNGLDTQAWFLISYTARLGKSLELFDQRHWRPVSSELDEEMRRRVAWDIIVLDRWQAIFKNRQGDLDEGVHVEKPSLHTFARYDFATGALLHSQDGLSESRFALMAPDTPQTFFFLRARNELSDIILDTHKLIRALPTMRPQEQHETAMAIEAAADKHEEGLTPDLDYNYASSAAHALQSRPSRPLQRAALALTSWSSLWYVRCVLTRVFLQDVTADSKLRFASLKYARNIIESMHATVSLSASPWIAFYAGWTTNHIFAAATTFASIFLTGANTGQDPSEFLNEDLNSIASSLFEVVKTLEILSAYGNTAAGISREILTRSLNSTETLRQRYADYTAAQRRVNADQRNRVAPPAPSFLLGPPPGRTMVPPSGPGYGGYGGAVGTSAQDHTQHPQASHAGAGHLGGAHELQGQRQDYGHAHAHGQAQEQGHGQGQAQGQMMLQAQYPQFGGGGGATNGSSSRAAEQYMHEQPTRMMPSSATGGGGALGGLVDSQAAQILSTMAHEYLPIYAPPDGSVAISGAAAAEAHLGMPAVSVVGGGAVPGSGSGSAGGGGLGPDAGNGGQAMNPDSTDLLLGILNMTEADWRAIL